MNCSTYFSIFFNSSLILFSSFYPMETEGSFLFSRICINMYISFNYVYIAYIAFKSKTLQSNEIDPCLRVTRNFSIILSNHFSFSFFILDRPKTESLYL